MTRVATWGLPLGAYPLKHSLAWCGSVIHRRNPRMGARSAGARDIRSMDGVIIKLSRLRAIETPDLCQCRLERLDQRDMATTCRFAHYAHCTSADEVRGAAHSQESQVCVCVLCSQLQLQGPKGAQGSRPLGEAKAWT